MARYALTSAFVICLLAANCHSPRTTPADAIRLARSYALVHEDTTAFFLDSVTVSDDGARWRVQFVRRRSEGFPAYRALFVDKKTGAVQSGLDR